MPIVVYPKGYVDEILDDVEKLRRDVRAGVQSVFSNVDDLIASLDF
jgi:hypothetical protein